MRLFLFNDNPSHPRYLPRSVFIPPDGTGINAQELGALGDGKAQRQPGFPKGFFGFHGSGIIHGDGIRCR